MRTCGCTDPPASTWTAVPAGAGRPARGRPAGGPPFQFWCDPVLGDNGRLYVPQALVEVYRDQVVPHAHALLPNQFEAENLSGVRIRTEADARAACDVASPAGLPRRCPDDQVLVGKVSQLAGPD